MNSYARKPYLEYYIYKKEKDPTILVKMPMWHNNIVSIQHITTYIGIVAIEVPVVFPKVWKTKLLKKFEEKKPLKTEKIVLV